MLDDSKWCQKEVMRQPAKVNNHCRLAVGLIIKVSVGEAFKKMNTMNGYLMAGP
jgi:hypothetical protein